MWMTLLWDPRLTELGITVQPADYEQPHWRLLAAWLTVNGSWDDVPDWARQWQLDTLGGDHHCFGRALDLYGNPYAGAGFVLQWPDGAAQRTPEADRWANIPIEAGFDWTVGAGPYSWAKYGNADVLMGLGLPYPPLPWELNAIAALGGVHVSYFGVWQEHGPELEPEPEPEPEPDSCWWYLQQWWKCVWGKL
jgi:hypothetical protein